MLDVKRIEAEHSLKENTLKVTCNDSEKIDMIAVNVIKNDNPPFLLPMKSISVNNTMQLRYAMGNQMALAYSKLIFKKEEFLQFYQNLITPLVQCCDWMLDYHYFCVDMGYVYLDKNSFDIFYMYLPIASGRNEDEEILDFFQMVLNRITVTDDSAFMVKLYQSFSRGNITLHELYEMVNLEQRQYTDVVPEPVESVVPVTKSVELQPEEKEPEVNRSDNFNIFSLFGSKGAKDVKEIKETDSVSKMLHPEDEVMAALFGEDKKADKKRDKKIEKKVEKKGKREGFFGKKKKSPEEPLPIQEISDQEIRQLIDQQSDSKSISPDYAQTGQDDEVTEIVGEYEQMDTPHLALLNADLAGVPSYVDLGFEKQQIILGRQSSDRVQPDIAFASHYKKIGRMHACIKREQDAYCIIDLGSANGTTLNGNVLIPNQQYSIKAGDEIGFIASDPIRYRVVM
jgi:hypothetical protein